MRIMGDTRGLGGVLLKFRCSLNTAYMTESLYSINRRPSFNCKPLISTPTMFIGTYRREFSRLDPHAVLRHHRQ